MGLMGDIMIRAAWLIFFLVMIGSIGCTEEPQSVQELQKELDAVEVQDACDESLYKSFSAGNTSYQLCYGTIDPMAEAQDIAVLEKCIAKYKEVLDMLSETEKVCADKGEDILGEIGEFRNFSTETITTMELLKGIEEGTATKEELLLELLKQGS